MRLSLVVIRVADLERSAHFYQSLGFVMHRERHGTGPLHYSADVHGAVLELYPMQGEESTAKVRLGFVVGDVSQVANACLEAGGQIVSAVKESPWGRRAVIEDLDGHRIELVEER